MSPRLPLAGLGLLDRVEAGLLSLVGLGLQHVVGTGLLSFGIEELIRLSSCSSLHSLSSISTMVPSSSLSDSAVMTGKP